MAMQYKDQVYNDSPLLYLTMNDPVDKSVDWSGYNRTILTNGPVGDADSLLLSEPNNRSASFTRGQNTWLYVPSSTVSWLNTDSITLEAWIKVTPNSGDGCILERYISGNQGFVLKLHDAYPFKVRISYWTYNSGYLEFHEFATPSLIDDQKAHHVVATYDHTTGTAKIYVNSNLVAQESGSAFPLHHHHAPLMLGAGEGGGDEGYVTYWHFDGSIDEVAIYGTALSAERIAAHYIQATAPPPTGPTATVWSGDIEIATLTPTVWDGTQEIAATWEVV